MKTAENTATGQEKTINEQLTDMFYLGVGICAVAKEKMEEVVDEFRARNPETLERGEKIVNDLIEEARTAAEKLSEDLKKTYADIKDQATDFVQKEKENIKSKMGKTDEEEDDDDVWADKDAPQDDEDLNDDVADDDDDDDLEYIDEDEDDADLENDEFEDENNGREMKDEYPRQHEASRKDNNPSPEVNTPPSNSEMSGNDVDGANGENPTRINPVL